MLKKLEGMILDPDGSWSSTRVSGILLVLGALAVAAWGAHTGREQSGTVTALAGGGGFAFLTRKKSGEADATQ